jgi:uncharacterized YccA/Bax inhibitor family protein
MKSANPVLQPKYFESARTLVYGSAEGSMSVQGTVNKAIILGVMLVIAASYVWTQSVIPASFGEGMVFNPQAAAPWVMLGGIGGFIIALVTTFKPIWSPYTAPIYAVLEGLFLGGISAQFEYRFPGVVVPAVMLTMGTLTAMLIAYKAQLIRVTDKFRTGMIAATGGIALVYFASIILGFFGVQIPLIHGSGMVGIGFSLVVVAVAALNLVLDFDFIEQGSRRNAPKYMEWFGAFGLMVTMVWLYLEFLRLLSKLNSRD